MLVIKPRGVHGDGLFDVIAKVASSAAAKQVGKKVINSAVGQKIARVANSAVGKKVLNSAVAKKIAENLTEEIFKKAANSAIGKQLEKVIESGVANASEKAAASVFKKLPKEIFPNNFSKEFPENFIPKKIKLETLIPKKLEKNRKRKIAVVPRLSRKKGKRRKIGKGIILE